MAPVLEMLTIDPPAPAAMREPTSDINRNGALKLSATTLSKSASGVSREEGASGDEPALLTRTSIRPAALQASSTR